MENSVKITNNVFHSSWPTVYVPIVLEDGANLPFYAHNDDACVDLTAMTCFYNKEHDWYEYGTGIHIAIPAGFEVQIRPRSGNRKTDAYICNTPGTVDCGYTGEVIVCFKNRTSFMVQKFMEMALSGYNNREIARELNEVLKKGDENLDYAPYHVGERIAQMKLSKCFHFGFQKVDSLDENQERGKNGFGSTGLLNF